VTDLGATAAAVRIARRDALRHKARSLLVVVMIALPVLALTGADVLARTMQLSPAEKVSRSLGRADAELTIVGGRVSQVGTGGGWSSNGNPALPGSRAYATAEAAAKRLLPGARMIEHIEAGGPINAGGRLVEGIQIEGLDLRDPITTGMARLVSGRFAAAADETTLTQPLLSRLHAAVGDTVTIARQDFRVVGAVRNPQAIKADEAYLLPSAVPAHEGDTINHELVDTTGPVTWPDVLKLNAHGVVAQSREVIEHPPPGVQLQTNSTLADRARTIGIATVAVGLAVLEVVLLAGAAFAVGARRQRRDLALVAAAGGDEGQVRSIVLAGGIVLGVVGGVLGVAGGIVAGRLVVPVAQRLADADAGHFDLRPVELLAVALIGVVTGLLAAVVPARTAARDDVVAALTGRRGVVATTRRLPVVGLLMIALGAVLAAYAAHPPVRFTLVLVGAVVAEIGFVVCAPWVVGGLARVARVMPLTMRLAMRDASRHRGRTGPAVAAVLAAVAGSISVSAWISSTLAYDRASYQPMLRVGQTGVQLLPDPAHPAPDVHAVQDVIRRDLPATALTVLQSTQCYDATRCTFVTVKPVGAHCPSGQTDCGVATVAGGLAVGDSRTLDALLMRHDTAADAALARGELVVFSPTLAKDGHSELAVEKMRASSNRPAHTVVLRSHVVDIGRNGAATAGIMSTATAASMHVHPQQWGYLLTTTRTPTQAEQDRAQSDLLKYEGNVLVEHGYQVERWNYGLLALAGAAALVTLGATAIATALSAADSRPDLVTLAAVGAGPRLRRRFAAGQATTVAVLGTLLGTVAGLVPAWAIVHAHGAMPFTMPWQTIGIVAVVVPVLAAIATGALTRSRLPSERRAT
jgi:putative ABC transport system permease protein